MVVLPAAFVGGVFELFPIAESLKRAGIRVQSRENEISIIHVTFWRVSQARHRQDRCEPD